MLRKKGKFTSFKNEKRREHLDKNSFKPIEEQINAAGDASTNEILDEVSWNEGRRIVELSFLASALFCHNCRSYLHLKDIEKEKRFRLASILDIRCRDCHTICSVATGKRHMTEESGVARCFDVNTKLAAAMINAGVGETQISNILATLNIPYPCHKTVKKREREIGVTIEKVAEESCSKAIAEEIAATSGDCATVLLDGGWQKRGSGQNHNSLSGHLAVIGKESKKCVSFGVAKKSCRKCKNSQKGKENIHEHGCRRNFNGSSKAMESFLAVRGLKKLKNRGLNVKRIVMDDDSTTYVRIKNSFDCDIEKCSDKNHVTKGFTNDLYKLKEKNNKLSVTIINYIRKCFNYAVTQNKGNPERMKSSLVAIIPHAFGVHDACTDQEWCRFKNENEYRHKSLPHCKDLTDESLKNDLELLFVKYTTGDMCIKLADLESTNAVENINQLIARKAPKSMHFSGSESLDFRVSAAVTQKNDGSSYISTVNETHKMSPGKVTSKRFNKLDKKRQERYFRQTSHDAKKRRLLLKEEKRVNQQFSENLEGISYQTGVLATDYIDADATEVVPEPLILKSEKCSLLEKSTVLFDLETTGFGDDADIIQLAALELNSGSTFNSYVFPPAGVIPQAVTKVTNIEIHGRNMYFNCDYVASTDIKTALVNFQNYLEPFGESVLVAHNALFDSKILMNSCKRCGVQLSNIKGFADTLSLFQKEYPERKANRLGYKQPDLVRDLLGIDYAAHSADEDVLALSKLLKTVEDFEVKIKTYSTEEIKIRLKRNENQKKHLNGYEDMLVRNVLVKRKAENLSSAGITVEHLKIIYNRSGYDGIHILFRKLLPAPEKCAQKVIEYFDANKNKL